MIVHDEAGPLTQEQIDQLIAARTESGRFSEIRPWVARSRDRTPEELELMRQARQWRRAQRWQARNY